MAMTVNTNIASLTVQKNLNRSSDALSISMSRLSSGLRINSAKDDAAGMQIAARMESQVRGQGIAIRNANNAISMANTAEGALREISEIVQHMRGLALQARNDNYGSEQRLSLNQEFAQKSDELTRITGYTNLGGKKLLDGTAGIMEFQVGAEVGEVNRVSVTLDKKFDAVSLGVASTVAGLSGATNAEAHTNIDNALTALDAALTQINATRAELGAVTNRLSSTISNLQNMNENAGAALGRIQDVDFAAETAELTKQQTLQQASTAVLAQANQLPAAVLKLLQ
jgi:flagellin